MNFYVGNLPFDVMQANLQHAFDAVEGDLGSNQSTVRQALHARGILPVGIPRTINPTPTPTEVLSIFNEAGWHRTRTLQ